ncbi:hypothetical protein JW859_02005 [bacterium]|nr:hypothetical protein [bacterium]
MRLDLSCLAVFIVVCILANSCNMSNAIAKTSSEVVYLSTCCSTELGAAEIELLVSMDLSEGISQCDYISPYSEEGELYSSWLPSSILKPELTEGEARLLGMTFTPPDGRRFIAETIGHVSSYYTNNGHLPSHGVELVPWAMTVEGFERICGMDAAEQYHYLYYAVNPVTGKFFESFDDSEWHPGGFFIEPVVDEELIIERYHSYVASPDQLPSVWHVIIFGEEPGTTLIDKLVATNCHQRKTPWPRVSKTTVEEK